MVRHRSFGFTIVELLIVVVIIAILATITVVAYNGLTGRTRASALQSNLGQMAKKLEITKVTTGSTTYAASLGDAGITLPSDGDYVYQSSSGSYCLQGSNGSIAYHVSNTSATPTEGVCPAPPIADGSFIQTVTSANCPSTRTRAVDARDNHTYWVQKLADGKCWMLTNLAYAGGGTSTYSDTKTLTNGTGGSPTYTVANYYVPTSGANVTTEPTPPSTSTNGTGQYGYLYNWCGAMGGQATAACANATTPTPDANTSVCPAGWRLPTSNTEFAALNTAVNGGSTSNDAGLLTSWFGQYGGYWYNGFVQYGADGNYWSSWQVSATTAWRLFFSSGWFVGVGPGIDLTKAYGFAMRCVAV